MAVILEGAASYSGRGVPCLGKLRLTEQSLSFIPASGDAKPVVLEVKSVSAQRVSKDTSNMVLWNLTVEKVDHTFDFTEIPNGAASRDSFRDALSLLTVRSDRSTAAPSTATAAAVAAVDNSREAVAERLLAKNRALARLHRDFVKAGIVSDAEFWEVHKVQLEAEAAMSERQTKGLQSTLRSFRPEFESSNKRVKRLTTSDIVAFFAEFPALLTAYREHVPHKISEMDFWTKVMASRLFYRGGTGAKEAEADNADKLFTPYMQLDKAKREELKRQLMRDIDPGLDLTSADGAPRGFGFPAVEEPVAASASKNSMRIKTKEGSLSEAAGEVMRRYNWHGGLVLNPQLCRAPPPPGTKDDAPSPQKSKAPRPSMVARPSLPELEPEPEPQVIPLKIAEQQRSSYFGAAAGQAPAGEHDAQSNGTGLTPAQIVEAFQQSVGGWSVKGQRRPAIDPKDALTALVNFSKMVKRPQPDVFSDGADAEFQDLLLRHSKTAAEYLRHFWCSFPPWDAASAAKVDKIAGRIHEMLDGIGTWKKSMNAVEEQRFFPRLEPLETMLAGAHAKWTKEKSTRKVVGKKRPAPTGGGGPSNGNTRPRTAVA
mmetsp:Transcript_27774/g.64019  ORF Transcript_27774/g.64019 Transcript_27774/m.64019 type:complete len:598 (+) Transcript_27774:53-1846(+)